MNTSTYLRPVFDAASDAWGYIDCLGNLRIPFRYQSGGPFQEGLAAIWLGDKYGFIDESGTPAIPCRFGLACGFSNGLAGAYVHETKRRCGMAGFINRAGKWVIRPVFDFVGEFSCGLAQVAVKKKWFFIDGLGKQQWGLTFSHASSFSDGLAMVSVGDRQGFIDTSGQYAIEPTHTFLTGPFTEGLTVAEENGRRFFIDRRGNRVFAGRTYRRLGHFQEGLAAVLIGRRWGFIDRGGRLALPARFRGMQWSNSENDTHGAGSPPMFSEGLAAVHSRGRMGYIDAAGRWAIRPTFDRAFAFKCGLAAVFRNHDRMYLDHAGCQVWPRPGDAPLAIDRQAEAPSRQSPSRERPASAGKRRVPGSRKQTLERVRSPSRVVARAPRRLARMQ